MAKCRYQRNVGMPLRYYFYFLFNLMTTKSTFEQKKKNTKSCIPGFNLLPFRITLLKGMVNKELIIENSLMLLNDTRFFALKNIFKLGHNYDVL